MPLRLLAMAAFKVRASWLQPILMLARDGGQLSSEKYREAILAMIDSRLEFISVDGQVVSSSLGSPTSIQLPEEFKRIVSRLGRAKADLASHTNVALNAVAQFWGNSALPWTLREAAVGALLENL
jgi:hypothetical protein